MKTLLLSMRKQLTAVRRRMGMVFQYSALFDSMTVGENVAFGLRQHTKTMKRRSSASLRRNSTLSAWKASRT